MPPAASDRRVVTVKLARAGVARIDDMATAAGVDRSEMVRRLLAYAAPRMPAGWKPQGG